MCDTARDVLARDIPSPDAYGMVWKRGRWVGVWKRRYFVVKGDTLYYFDANKKGEPLKTSRGSFDLSQWKFEHTTPSSTPSSPSPSPTLSTHSSPTPTPSTTTPSSPSPSPRYFNMRMVRERRGREKGGGEFFLLRAESEEEMRKWMSVTAEAYYQARFGAHLQKIIRCQAVLRGRKNRMRWRKMRNSAVLIQATYRMHLRRSEYLRLRLRLIKIQAYARSWLVRKDYKAIVRRKRIAAEMLSTERIYVNNLLTVVELFQNPLTTSTTTSTPILSTYDVSVMFGNIAQVRDVNAALLDVLEKRMENWRVGSKIGDVFQEHADKLMVVYVPYILQYSEATECVERNKKKSQQFKDFLQRACEDPRTKGLDIVSMLIQPVQRLPRYELLLRDLLKCTEESHTDYADINEGLQRVIKVTTHINEKRRDKESVVQIQELKSNLVGQLAAQIEWEIYHKLIREGEATCTLDPKVTYIILTNDFLLLTQKQKEKYRVRMIVYLRDVCVSSCSDEDGAQSAEKITITPSSSENIVLHTPAVGKPWSVDIGRVIEHIQLRNTTTSPKLSRSVIMRPKGTLAKMMSFGLQSLSSSSASALSSSSASGLSSSSASALSSSSAFSLSSSQVQPSSSTEMV